MSEIVMDKALVGLSIHSPILTLTQHPCTCHLWCQAPTRAQTGPDLVLQSSVGTGSAHQML